MADMILKRRGGAHLLTPIADAKGAGGQSAIRYYQVTGPTSYTTGGMGTASIAGDFPGGVQEARGDNGAYKVRYDKATDKWIFYDLLDATAANVNAEVANATDLSGVTLDVVAHGWV